MDLEKEEEKFRKFQKEFYILKEAGEVTSDVTPSDIEWLIDILDILFDHV